MKLLRQKPTQTLYPVTLIFDKGLTRQVRIKASSREVAEKRALKRNPSALGVKGA